MKTASLTLLAALLIAPVTAAPAYASSPFANCAEAYAAGQANIPASSPYYGKHLDRDNDGIACDNPPADFTPAPSASPTPKPTPSASSDVTAVPSTDGDLAETGAGISPLPFVMGAGGLILAGGAALTLRRRNR